MKIHVQCLVHYLSQDGCLITLSLLLLLSGSCCGITDTHSFLRLSGFCPSFLLFVLIACACFEGSNSKRSSLGFFESLFSLIVPPLPLIRITPASSTFSFYKFPEREWCGRLNGIYAASFIIQGLLCLARNPLVTCGCLHL